MSHILSNGTVLPSGLLGVHGMETAIAGFNHSYRNTGLKAGVVIKSYAADDPNNKSGLCTEYDVLTIEQFENKGTTSILYRNCLSSQGFGSKADFLEFTVRYQTTVVSNGTPTFSNQDGAVVLIKCLNNIGDKAIVEGCLIHPDRPTTITSTNPQLAFTYNGVAVNIANDGSFSLAFNGATDNEGNPTDSSQGTTTVNIETDGSFQVMHQNITFRLDKQGEVKITATGDLTVSCDNANVTASGDANITASGTTTVEAPTVNLGKNASDAVVKGTTFQTYFNTHIHSTALGPSGTPIEVMPANTLSTKVNTE